jgi:hypothetical protein
VYCFDQRYERRVTGPTNPDDSISVARFVIDPRLLETWKARLARLQFRGSTLIERHRARLTGLCHGDRWPHAADRKR